MKHPKSSNLVKNAINKNDITLIIGKSTDFSLLSKNVFLSKTNGKYPIKIGMIIIYVQELISRISNSTKTLKIKA